MTERQRRLLGEASSFIAVGGVATVVALVLFNALVAANAETTQYTTPSGTRTIIDKFTGTNTSGAPATLTVKLVPNGGGAAASNTIVQTKTLQAGET